MRDVYGYGLLCYEDQLHIGLNGKAKLLMCSHLSVNVLMYSKCMHLGAFIIV